MASQNLFDNPYIKAALAQKQQQDVALQQQQQAYNNKLAEIEKSKTDALSQLDSEILALPENIRAGAGVQHDLNVERKRVERDAELAKIALAPESKGAAELISLIGKKYPESELKPFTETDTFKQTNEAFSKISEKFRVADILNKQLDTFGQDLVKAKEADAAGQKDLAAAYRESAKNYGVTQLTQNLANAVNPNAQQRDEFIRQASALIDPALVASQGGSLKQIVGSMWAKLTGASSTDADKLEARSSLLSMINDSISADPEKWYQTAQKANKDFMSEKTRLLQDQVINRVGVRHAVQMGARKPVANDPLANYMSKVQQPKQPSFGQADESKGFTVTTGAGTSIPVQSGTMGPTSRPRTKFTILNP